MTSSLLCLKTPGGTLCLGFSQQSGCCAVQTSWPEKSGLCRLFFIVWPHDHGCPTQVVCVPVSSMGGRVKTELMSCLSVPPSPKPSSHASPRLCLQLLMKWVSVSRRGALGNSPNHQVKGDCQKIKRLSRKLRL